jgi:hypothetical protein
LELLPLAGGKIPGYPGNPVLMRPKRRRTIFAEINWPMGLFSIFKLGDVVPTSGVYATWHSTPHALIEHTICLEGQRLPGCRLCPLGVMYRLERPGVPIFSTMNLPEQGFSAC